MDSLIRLKVEWFHNSQWWFGCNIDEDAYLTKTYGHWIDEDYCDYKWDINDKDIAIAWILVYDQIVRHVQRHEPYRCLDIESYRVKAVQLVDMLLKHFDITIFSGHEFGFLMLPYRHSYEWKEVYRAIEWTWKKINSDKCLGRYDSIEEIRPFLKATYGRCPMATFELCYEDDIYAHYIGNKHDWNIHKSKYQSILEYTPLGTISSMELMSFKSLSLIQIIEASLKKHQLNDKPILVSLSGGVDSMVILWILVQLQKKYGFRLMAVYINYCNRTDKEEEFVVSWCTSLGVDIFVRRIREIQRAPAMELEIRNVYETYTRDCRYQTYKEAWKLLHGTGMPWITMGHNEDDCFENIITNICHKQKYEELDGMKDLGENSQMLFWRPMLNIAKKHIYEFAKQAQIPYLHDSTPKWSCRGKIRDTIRPALETFNPEVIHGFFHLSKTMRDLMKHISEFVDIAYQNTYSMEPSTRCLIFSKFMPSSLLTSDLFWRMYLMKLWNLTVSIKSIKHFCERVTYFLKQDSMHKIRIILVKGKEVYVEKINQQVQFTWLG